MFACFSRWCMMGLLYVLCRAHVVPPTPIEGKVLVFKCKVFKEKKERWEEWAAMYDELNDKQNMLVVPSLVCFSFLCRGCSHFVPGTCAPPVMGWWGTEACYFHEVSYALSNKSNSEWEGAYPCSFGCLAHMYICHCCACSMFTCTHDTLIKCTTLYIWWSMSQYCLSVVLLVSVLQYV